MSKGFFDKSAVRYVLKISMKINVPERLFDYDVEYGLGYPSTKSDKSSILEIGKYINKTNHPLRILPENLAQWEMAIQNILTNQYIPVSVCSLEVVFVNQMVRKNTVSINKKIDCENIELSEAMYHWNVYKNHILSLITSRKSRNTLFHPEQAVSQPAGEKDYDFCNII